MLNLKITALSHSGDGIAHAEGRTVFVPGALPGETVSVEITQTKKEVARARLVEVVDPAPERIQPPCPVFNVCGGCQLQHLGYLDQLRFKENQVRVQLRRLARLDDPPVRPIVPAPEPFGYRNQIQWSLTADGGLGLRGQGTHDVVPVEACLIAHPAINAARAHLVLEPDAGLERLTIRVDETGDPLLVLEPEEETPEVSLDLALAAAVFRPDGTTFALAERDWLEIEVLGRPFRVSAGSFFQVNLAQAERLVALVLEALDPHPDDVVLDLFCGVGLFTAFVAPHVSAVVGVESYAPAVDDAAINLDASDNVSLYLGAVEEILPALAARPTAVVLDPPRAGLAAEAAEALAATGATRIAYVSCDPATLARDVARLARHGYRLAWAQPVDMFPQTFHIETVALLVK